MIYAADPSDPEWRAGHVAVEIDPEQGRVAPTEQNRQCVGCGVQFEQDQNLESAMSKTPPPVRPAAPRPPASAKKPTAAPLLTTPLTPDEAKRMAAVLMAMLKD